MNFTPLKNYQDYLTSWRIPGNDCMVVKDGKEIYRYMSGYADCEKERKIAGDELYYFWSASKVITCSLALKLHEEGKFIMNDPLSAYMPEFGEMTVRRTIDGKEEIVKAEKPILVKNLFNMTAGFDYNISTPYIDEVKKKTNGRCPTREVAAAIAKNPLCFEPGEHWNYSLCHDVLGAFIEVVSGKKLRDYAREVLFEPLGMNDTTYNMPEESKRSRFAVQYNYRDDLGKFLPTNNTCGHFLGCDYDSGGAGVVSTCEDYMKFASTMANGGTSTSGYRYVSPATVELMATNTLGEAQMKDFNWGWLRLRRQNHDKQSSDGFALSHRRIRMGRSCRSLGNNRPEKQARSRLYTAYAEQSGAHHIPETEKHTLFLPLINKKTASTGFQRRQFCVIRLFVVLRFFGFFFLVVAAVDEVENDVDGYDDEVEEVNYKNVDRSSFACAQTCKLSNDTADIADNYEKNERKAHSFCRLCLVVFDNRKRP